MPQKSGEVKEMLPKLYARLQAEAVMLGPPGCASDCVQGALAANGRLDDCPGRHLKMSHTPPCALLSGGSGLRLKYKTCFSTQCFTQISFYCSYHYLLFKKRKKIIVMAQI